MVASYVQQQGVASCHKLAWLAGTSDMLVARAESLPTANEALQLKHMESTDANSNMVGFIMS